MKKGGWLGSIQSWLYQTPIRISASVVGILLLIVAITATNYMAILLRFSLGWFGITLALCMIDDHATISAFVSLKKFVQLSSASLLIQYGIELGFLILILLLGATAGGVLEAKAAQLPNPATMMNIEAGLGSVQSFIVTSLVVIFVSAVIFLAIHTVARALIWQRIRYHPLSPKIFLKKGGANAVWLCIWTIIFLAISIGTKPEYGAYILPLLGVMYLYASFWFQFQLFGNQGTFRQAFSKAANAFTEFKHVPALCLAVGILSIWTTITQLFVPDVNPIIALILQSAIIVAPSIVIVRQYLSTNAHTLETRLQIE